MKNALKMAFAVPVLAHTATCVADIEFSRPLNNPAHEQASAHVEFSYFDLSFDLLDYVEKIESRSRPEEIHGLSFSLHMPLAQRVSFDYQHTDTFSRVSRSAQPYEVETDGFEHQLQLNYWLMRLRKFSNFNCRV